MKLMGEQFVTGQNIAGRWPTPQVQGLSLPTTCWRGGATEADAQRYLRDYQQAIHAIGAASAGRGILKGRASRSNCRPCTRVTRRAQYDRVMGELLPRVPPAELAKQVRTSA